jgi:hypothetical protein
MRTLALAFLVGFSLTVGACENQPPSAPQGGDDLGPVAGVPMPSALATCRYTTNPPGGGTPVSIVSIPVGTGLAFIPTNANKADCDGAWGFLSPTDGRVEFNLSGSPCTDFSQQAAGPARLLKVYRCFAGGASLSIYTNSSKTTLLQVIGIDVLP